MSHKSIRPLSQPIPIKLAGCCMGFGVKNLPCGHCYVALNQVYEIISLYILINEAQKSAFMGRNGMCYEFINWLK